MKQVVPRRSLNSATPEQAIDIYRLEIMRNPSNRARFGPYEVDLHTHELWKFGIRIKLAGQPFEILAMLLREPGELVTRDDMRTRLWPSDTFVDFNHGLNAAVNKLREALSDSADHPRFIETLPRRGYRFVAKVEWLEETAPPTLRSSLIPRPESESIPQFPLQAELLAKSATATSTWPRYLMGAGAIFSVLVLSVYFIPPVSRFSEAHTPPVVEHTRPLLSVSDTETPGFSPDGNSVAFVRESSKPGDAGIYVTAVGDDHPLQLTNDRRDCCPVWSPDGRFIAFTRGVESSYSIHIVTADGGRLQKRQAESPVAAYAGSTLVQRIAVQSAAKSLDLDHELPTGGIRATRGAIDWSPAGNLIAFAAADGIYLVSPEDSNTRRLTSTPHLAQDWGPAFSPDGKTVLFVRDHQADLSNEILSVSVEGGDWKHIFSELGKISSPPRWSFDGRSIIFSSNRNGHPALWRVALDSSAEAIQISEAGSPAWYPAVSRRGYRLAYERELRSLSIWQMDLTVSDKQPYLALSSTSSTDQGPGPQFSPDGQKLAYMSDRSGTMEIWIANRDGSTPFQLTAVGGAGTPRWSPDSKALVFDVSSTTGAKIVFMNLYGGAPQTLAEGVCPSFSRNGNWVYFASARNNGWQVWKVPAAGGSPIQVTRHGGHAALESLDGKYLYYAKTPMAEPEVWRMPSDGGEESPVPLVRPGSWASWQLTRNGILFVGPGLGHQAVLSFYDFARGRAKTVSVLNRIPFWLGATQDGKLVAFDQPGQEQSQAMLVENFR
jgi:Tol biopolymer transport system component/DNA-binding winged helix-turn-helix (wHTH) protein